MSVQVAVVAESVKLHVLAPLVLHGVSTAAEVLNIVLVLQLNANSTRSEALLQENAVGLADVENAT